jgi:hypothetical protein
MPEQFKNYAQTTLSVAALSTDVTLSVLSVSGWPTTGNFRLRIDDPAPLTTFEYVLVTSVNVGANQVTVTRGQESTTAIAHPINAIVGNEFTAAAIAVAFPRLDTALGQTFTSALNVPVTSGGAYAPSIYGSFPVKIDEQLPIGGSGTFNLGGATLPPNFRHLLIELQSRSDRAAQTNDECGIRFNSDSAANYGYVRFNNTGTAAVEIDQGASGQTSGRAWFTCAATALASAPGLARIWIPNYNGSTFKKMARIDSAWYNGTAFAAANAIQSDYVTIFWNNAAAITRLDLILINGNWLLGTVATLYGIP